MVKAVQVIPPLAALLVIGVPMGKYVFDTSMQERANRILEFRIHEVENLTPREAPKLLPDPEDQAVVTASGVSWERVLDACRAEASGLPDVRVLKDFNEHLRDLDETGWRTLLAELDELELESQDRELLDEAILGPLTEESPELAFARFAANFAYPPSPSIAWHLENSFARWLREDPEAAVHWYREALAAGQFESKALDGRNNMRTAFDSILVRNWLLEGDAETAEAYLSELPPDQRAEILWRPGRVIPADQQRVFANLVRAQVPAESRDAVLAAEIVGLGRRTDLQQVARAMDRIAATREERSLIAERAVASELSRDGSQSGESGFGAISSVREWLNEEAPEEADRITGTVLGTWVGDEREFANRVATLEVLLDRGAGQEMLVSFLEGGGAQRYQAGVSRLLGRVADPNERIRLGEQLGIGTTAEVGP